MSSQYMPAVQAAFELISTAYAALSGVDSAVDDGVEDGVVLV